MLTVRRLLRRNSWLHTLIFTSRTERTILRFKKKIIRLKSS